MQFRKINGGTDIQVVQNGDTIDINFNGPAPGDVNNGIQDFELMLDSISIDGNDNDVYITNAKQGNVAGDTTNLVEGTIIWVPVYVNRSLNAQDLAFNYINAVSGTGSFTMGIYDNIGSGENYPDQLLDSASGSLTATVEAKTVNIFSSLTPGLYWIAIVFSHPNTSLIGVTRNDTQAANCVGHFDDDNSTKILLPILGYTDSGTFLPGTAPSNMDIVSGDPPALYLRLT